MSKKKKLYVVIAVFIVIIITYLIVSKTIPTPGSQPATQNNATDQNDFPSAQNSPNEVAPPYVTHNATK